MYRPEKELIMDTKSFKKVTQTAILNNLLFYHSEFQEYLDIMAASNISGDVIDVLIQIRQFNIDCISRYTDLISKSNIFIKATPSEYIVSSDRNFTDPLVLTRINNKLSMLLPAYRRALSNKALRGFSRMIIGNNYEKIVSIKDNLLHPLPEYQIV